MNLFHTLSAGALALAVTAHAEDQAIPVTRSFISRLASEAVRHHPKISAARSRVLAADMAVKAVRLWEDPEAGLGATAAPRSYRQSNGDMAAGIAQKLPRRGLYEAQKRKAEADRQALSSEAGMNASEVGQRVAEAALELALVDDVLALQREDFHWMESMASTAGERSKNPGSSAVESLRMESELALKRQRVAAAERQRVRFAATLNLLLGRDAQSPWPALTLPREMAAPAPSTTAASALVEARSPRLAGLRHQVEAAGAEIDMAREKRRPALSVGVDTNTASSGGFFDAMFSLKVSLPWFNDPAYKADVSRAEQLRAAAQGDLQTEAKELKIRLRGLLTEADNSRLLAASYQTEVVPKMEKAAEAVQNAWVSSKATLLEVLEARRLLFDTRQEMDRAVAAEHAALAAITALEGGFAPSTPK